MEIDTIGSKKSCEVLMKKRFEIFSSKRLRQILNDIKRNSDIAGKELKFQKTIKSIFKNSEKTLDINLVKKFVKYILFILRINFTKDFI